MERLAHAVFAGGGVKAVGLAGALWEAERRGLRWVEVAGSSAGALVAALVAAGYSGEELRTALLDLDFTRFVARRALPLPGLLGDACGLLFRGGIYSLDFLEAFVAEMLHRKRVRTFGDLAGRGRKLKIVVSDVSRSRLLLLPDDIAYYGARPDKLEVAAAVRWSASLPYFFAPECLRYEGEQGPRCSYFLDGGVLSNFPVWVVDPTGDSGLPVIGFQPRPPAEGLPRRIGGPLSLLSAIFATMLDARDAYVAAHRPGAVIIAVPTAGVGTVEFSLSAERRRALFQAGVQASVEALDRAGL